MVYFDLQHTLSFQISLRNGALLRMGYDVVFNAAKIIHAGFHLFGQNSTRRDYALGVSLYSLVALITSSIALTAVIWRDTKWLYRVLPCLFLAELIFVINCLGHDYASCTRTGDPSVPPCVFSLLATIIHAALGAFGLSVIWSYANRLEQKELADASEKPNVCPVY